MRTKSTVALMLSTSQGTRIAVRYSLRRGTTLHITRPKEGTRIIRLSSKPQSLTQVKLLLSLSDLNCELLFTLPGRATAVETDLVDSATHALLGGTLLPRTVFPIPLDPTK